MGMMLPPFIKLADGLSDNINTVDLVQKGLSDKWSLVSLSERNAFGLANGIEIMDTLAEMDVPS